MINDASFQVILIKTLKHNVNAKPSFEKDKMWEVNLYIEEICLFTRFEWRTNCSILHIQVPIDKQDFLTY